jgi:hypothetical protein
VGTFLALTVLASVLALTSGASRSVASPDDEDAAFTIESLSMTDGRAIDTVRAIGDDGGFPAITDTHVIMTGDHGLVGYPLHMAVTGAPCETVRIFFSGGNTCQGPQRSSLQAALFSDVKTSTAYLFDMTLTGEIGEISGFWPLSDDGGFSDSPDSRIELSQTISTSNRCLVTASGWGRVVVWEICTGVVYDIALPSGLVTAIPGAWTASDFGANFGTPRGTSEAWYPFTVASHGVAEIIDGRLWIALPTAGSSIARYGVMEQNPISETIAELPEPADFYAFTISTQHATWCAHIEGYTTVLGPLDGMEEGLYCAPMTATFPPQPDAEPDDESICLAETGGAINIQLGLGLGCLGIALGMIVIALTRTPGQASGAAEKRFAMVRWGSSRT